MPPASIYRQQIRRPCAMDKATFAHVPPHRTPRILKIRWPVRFSRALPACVRSLTGLPPRLPVLAHAALRSLHASRFLSACMLAFPCRACPSVCRASHRLAMASPTSLPCPPRPSHPTMLALPLAVSLFSQVIPSFLFVRHLTVPSPKVVIR
ncbi:hypothetical protein HAX54_025046 [Datura stramonium]|uniref:Uncharacterized protein n=1 Tax=Datura stramonium TaxID=4076 RepID=A0ABS8UYV1_DATST|nr:hypothetical protein [Datura stramonium]